MRYVLAEMEFNGKLLWNYYDCNETMVTTTEIPATSTISHSRPSWTALTMSVHKLRETQRLWEE